MAEEWLEKLARQIKDKERKGAEESAKSKRRIQVVRRKGPAYWKSFSEALRKDVDDLKELLDGDVTLAEGPLTFAMDSSSLQITLAKTAFPSVQFTATPQFEKERGEISYQAATSRPDPGSPTSMSCKFEIRNDDRISIELDGKSFANSQEAALFVMEKLFRLPTSKKAYSQDSHLGRVGSE